VSDLEEVDIEVREPTVVMSVRLDGGTAKAIAALARTKGRKVSDVLREAAASYAASGGEPHGATFEIRGDYWRVVLGRPSGTTFGRTLTEGEDFQAFGQAPFRTSALIGRR
jgi:hypothetical protein